MTRRVLVLHGPNVNLRDGYEVLEAQLLARASAQGLELKSFQSNWEPALVDRLHQERAWAEVFIVNAATLAPTAVTLAEALGLLKRPAIEVLLDERLKARSLLKPVVQKQIVSVGFEGYLKALEVVAPKGAERPPVQLLGRRPLAPKTLGRAEARAAPPQSVTVAQAVEAGNRRKTLGRRTVDPEAKREGGKTIGRAPARAVSGEHVVLSRSMVRAQIAERLSGRLSPAELATWARSEWQRLQRGAPVESGQRDALDDVLQQLLLSSAMKASDHQLITLMTQLGD